MLVIAGIGSGLTAGAATDSGVAAVALYNTAVYRVKGIPTALSFLPYDDCNQLTLATLPEVIGVVRGRVPVLMGVGAHDPRIQLEAHLKMLKQQGVSGVMNEPFVGIYSKEVRDALDREGIGWARELELMEIAKELGLETLAWAFDGNEATRFASIGVTWIGAMAGIMSDSPNDREGIDRCVESLHTMAVASRSVDPRIPVLGHGGPLNSSLVIDEVVSRARLDGIVTGSNGERLPAYRGVRAELETLVASGAWTKEEV
ncbi:MAG: phosphoenolpyruvate hydrolase family protein [Scrofimicrobium sp.]